MEISKLKLELYDLAAIILPGFFLITEPLVPIFVIFEHCRSPLGVQQAVCSGPLESLTARGGIPATRDVSW